MPLLWFFLMTLDPRSAQYCFCMFFVVVVFAELLAPKAWSDLVCDLRKCAMSSCIVTQPVAMQTLDQPSPLLCKHSSFPPHIL